MSFDLHVPHVPARPGDVPNFAYLNLSAAGTIDRPPVDVPAREAEFMSRGLIRVLDEAGQAVGPWVPPLRPDMLQEALRMMLLTRALDERLLRAQRQGRITFYMPSTGEEAVSVGQGIALEPGDMLFPSYRNQGLHVARGRSLIDLMCQCLSNTRDMCRGRQLPVFYQWRAGNIFSISGNLGTQLPQAVGWAMAASIRGQEHIAATWTGEGATAEADFHHALTFAAVYRAPVLINIVNNQWAISTFQGVAGGECEPFAARGLGLGLVGLRVDGNDLLAMYAATRWAAERARRGFGASVIEAVTYRVGPHSTSDDPSRYRPKEDPVAFPLGDPIERLKGHLVAIGAAAEQDFAALRAGAEAQVESDWREALAAGSLSEGPRIDGETLFDDVFAERTPQLERQLRQFRALRED